MKNVLDEYYFMFDEYPFLLTTQSYEDDDYQILMLNAINRGTPLTREEIENWFKNNYDIVIEKKDSINVLGKRFDY